MFDLRIATPDAWLEVVLSNFDAFLVDHAACERKAFSTGMSFVSRYPDRKFLIEPMIEFAREELDHFHQVYRIIDKRGLTLKDDYKDVYVNALLKQCRSGKDELFVDRLLVAGIVEARSCERLLMVAEGLKSTNTELSDFYFELGRAESRHHAFFFRLARQVFSETEVHERAGVLLDFEADLVQRLPHRAAVH